jgi:hypothetical protein
MKDTSNTERVRGYSKVVGNYCYHYDRNDKLVLRVKITKQASVEPKPRPLHNIQKPYPSREQLLALFDYNQADNTLRWKHARKGVKAGDIVGWKNYGGYKYGARVASIDGEEYRVQILIDIYLGKCLPNGATSG